MNKIEFYKKHLKTDIPSGMVVFLIALPLCLGISLASGAPLITGIMAGIIGGTVVGFCSGSHVNVSGPAASVAVIILTALSTLGSFEAVLVSVIIAGVIQILLGFLGAGIAAYFFPSSMIKGFLASIGLILIFKQIPHAVGYDAVFEGSTSFMQEDGHNTLSELYYMMQGLQPGAIFITIFSLILINLWDRPKLKEKYAFFKFFPGALAAVLASLGINQAFEMFFPKLALDPSHLVKLPAPETMGEVLNYFSFPDFSKIGNPEVYMVAISIAFVASLESLLSTEAGDSLDPYKRKTNTNRELKAQGIGNIVAGLVGALPITAVIVRTSANVASGGRTKASTITHGIIMLFCVLLIPGILNKIPLASLSAVLFVVGYKLTSFKLYKEMYKKGRRQFIPFISTIIAVMFTDVITGIIVGGVVSVFIILRDVYKTPYFKDATPGTPTKVEYKLSEEVTFLNKASIMNALIELPEDSKVIVDASKSVNIDIDVLEFFEDFKQDAKLKNIDLKYIGFEKFAKVSL